jgi:hypothetical protein
MDDDKITVSRKEYLDLRLSAARLQCLEAGGVDNWDGFSDSIEDLESLEDEIKKEVADIPDQIYNSSWTFGNQ